MTRSRLCCLAVGLVIAIAAAAPAVAGAWAPAGSATIKPGNMTYTAGCSMHLELHLPGRLERVHRPGRPLLGHGRADGHQRLHQRLCANRHASDVDGASRPGTLVYNSWLTMQALGETDPDTCQYNDLALIKLDPADVANVNPSVPGFGGPTGLGSSAAKLGDTVYSYGNSSLRMGVTKLSPKQGIVASSEGNGWSRTVYTVTPGIPGDSGSGFMDASGNAIGILSTLQLAPTPASNGVGDLRHELDYLHAHSSFTGVQLVNGTQPFKPNLVGAILGS